MHNKFIKIVLFFKIINFSLYFTIAEICVGDAILLINVITHPLFDKMSFDNVSGHPVR